MNRHLRTLFVVSTLLGAVAFAAPGVSALGDEGDGDDDGDTRGEKVCHRVVGYKTCVAVVYGDCLLWVSAGIGGCIVMMPGAANAA